jgi:hypothetical protein
MRSRVRNPQTEQCASVMAGDYYTSLAPLISIPHLSFDSIEPPVYAIDAPVLSHDVSSSSLT